MKKRILAVLVAGLMALALTACGGSSGGGSEEAAAPDYLGTYNLCKITMGSLVMAPDDYDYGGAYITVDGTTFSLEENGSTLKGTIENDCIALTLTAADLGGEGDAEAMVMYFGLAGSEAETKLKDEVTQAGTLDEQMEAMGTDGLMQFMEDYGYLFGQ